MFQRGSFCDIRLLKQSNQVFGDLWVAHLVEIQVKRVVTEENGVFHLFFFWPDEIQGLSDALLAVFYSVAVDHGEEVNGFGHIIDALAS